MRTGKQPKPAGACSVCGALTRRRELLNHRCGQVVSGRRCAGVYKSAMTSLWDACVPCEATGRVGSLKCGECGGFGWRMYG